MYTWSEGIASCNITTNIAINPNSPALSQQEAAQVLGYTEYSWDNLSGQEKQPASTFKEWIQLTTKEKTAAVVLGYIEQTWGKQEATEHRKKSWSELTSKGADLVFAVLVSQAASLLEKIRNQMLEATGSFTIT